MKIIEIDTDCHSEFPEVQGDIGDFIRGRLNGYMEIVHPRGLDAPFVMIVDEEGLLKGLPLNPVGYVFYGGAITGKIVIAKIVEVDSGEGYMEHDIGGLTDEDMQNFTALYGCGINRLRIARKEGKI